jgi:hypothetical protein
VTIRTRARGAANRSAARMSCYSPGVFLAVLAMGAIVVATHWHGVLSGVRVAVAAAFAAGVGIPAGLAIISLGDWAADARERRSARRREEAVQSQAPGAIGPCPSKWNRHPGSALGRAEDDLSDAASRRAMSAPSPFRWQGAAASVWSPARQPAREDRETGTAPGLGLLGDGRQYGSLEELEAARIAAYIRVAQLHPGSARSDDGRVLLPGGTLCDCEWCGLAAARQAAALARGGDGTAGVPWRPLSSYSTELTTEVEAGAVVGIRIDAEGNEVPVTAGEALNISTGARPDVLERSRQAMAASEALLEQAGQTWRSGEARRTAEASWRHVPAEQAWRHWSASNAAGPRLRPPGQALPATDPITGAPIHYDETP